MKEKLSPTRTPRCPTRAPRNQLLGRQARLWLTCAQKLVDVLRDRRGAAEVYVPVDVRREHLDVPRAVSGAIDEYLLEFYPTEQCAALRIILKENHDQVSGVLYLARS